MDLKSMMAGSLIAAGMFVVGSAFAGALPDHEEFEIGLHVPFAGAAARPIGLHFSYPGAAAGTPVAWEVELLAPNGTSLRSWQGQSVISASRAQAKINWDGRDGAGRNLAAGYYTVRLQAIALDNDTISRIGTGLAAQALPQARAHAPALIEEQRYDVQVGAVAAPKMPAFAPLSRHAGSSPRLDVQAQSVSVGGSLPYTIYYGNLHSQTNHSDGGGNLSTCVGAQNPQSGAYGPSDAYQYALNDGLDILMTSEHNHMYDGSTGTNTSANPATAHNLYQSGLQAATTFNGAHPNFLAIYGLEWGVISGGGHLNIFNSPSLLEWEYNSAGQLIGDVYTAKSDYGSLYTLMHTNGWVGQFNHPASSGQFNVSGTDLAYTTDGDAVMALAEVLNISAYYTNTTETESSRTSYEAAYNILLTRGYHVAPSSDQDNHCANWGASYTNRTGVLIPNGTTLSLGSFLDAVRARRVFATEDKTGQIVLTANGNLMGQRFSNSGSLALTVNYASTSGRTAQRVQIFEGVPGSNGTVTTTASAATATITPATGDHFYYAKITQDDGKQLWSAPVWVTQGAATGGPDTIPPTVSATESGSSGTITLSANATDNVGVAKVEFYIDNSLVGTVSATPYQLSVDSSTLANGTHSLVAKAYDAANNVGASSAVSFSISNTTTGGGTGTGTGSELVQNNSFENGTSPWTQTTGVINSDTTEPAHTGSWKAWLDGYGTTHTDYVRQQITIPAGSTKATLDFFMHIDTAETTTTTAYDTLSVQVIDPTGKYVTLATWSNLDASSGYVEHTVDLSAYVGQTIWINFYGKENASNQTSFVIDDVSVKAQ